MAGIYLDWLWFGSLGFAGVFLTRFLSAWIIRILTWLIFALFLFLNLNYTQKAIMEMPNLVLRQLLMNSAFGNLLTPKRLQRLFLGVAIVISWLATSAYKHEWLTIRLFWPVIIPALANRFWTRCSFLSFALPFWQLIYRYLFLLLVATILICGAVYLLIQPRSNWACVRFLCAAAPHLSVLLAAAFLLRAFGYRLQMYGLLHSPREQFTDLLTPTCMLIYRVIGFY